MAKQKDFDILSKSFLFLGRKNNNPSYGRHMFYDFKEELFMMEMLKKAGNYVMWWCSGALFGIAVMYAFMAFGMGLEMQYPLWFVEMLAGSILLAVAAAPEKKKDSKELKS